MNRRPRWRILAKTAAPAFVAALLLPIGAQAATPPTPDQLELNVSPQSLRVGDQTCAEANVTGITFVTREAVPGITVRFSVTGTTTKTGSATTDTDGKANYCYTSSAGGFDDVNAYADVDGSGTQDAGEPGNSAQVNWSVPPLQGRMLLLGSDFYGQIGTGQYGVYQTRPWPDPVWTAAAGPTHILVAGVNGTAYAAGSIEHYQAGPNMQNAGCTLRYICNPRPEPMGGDLTGQSVTRVAAGGQHSLAMTQDGTVYSWGDDASGQLGNAPDKTCFVSSAIQDPCRIEPKVVPGLLETRVIGGAAQPPNTWIVQIAAGGDFSLVLKADTGPGTGTVWGWGNFRASFVTTDQNLQYETSSAVPVQIKGLSGIRSLAVGPNWFMALKSDGTVWFLGGNGDVGPGTIDPVQLFPTELTNIVAVAGGDDHALALRNDGTVFAWGIDTMGEVGTGVDDVRVRTPVQVSGLTGVVAIAAGAEHSVALKGDGTVWAWGKNSDAQLGQYVKHFCSYGGLSAFTSCSRIPVQIPGASGAFSIQAGGENTIVLDQVPPPAITPEGTAVMVSPGLATVTFTNVNTGGVTTSTAITSALLAPKGFQGATFEVSTTAAYSGSIEVCFPYAPDAIAHPYVYHAEGGVWVDRTSSVDAVKHLACATVSSFSAFALMGDSEAPTLTAPANVTVEATSLNDTLVPDATLGSPTASDNSGSAPTIIRNPSGNHFAVGTTAVTWTAIDPSGNAATATQLVTVADTTPPQLTLPADITTSVTSNGTAVVTYSASGIDLVDGSVPITCTPTSGATFNVGTTAVTCSATDSHNNVSTGTFKVNVLYVWSGFFAPVNNPNVVNTVKSGSAIPVKFSLSGNQGTAIFAAGYPQGQLTSCLSLSSNPTDPVETTVTAGGSSLTYDSSTGQYAYIWKTQAAWAGQCVRLDIKLADGTIRSAYFHFSK